MNALWWTIGGFVVAVWVAVFVMESHKRGYRQGRRDADNWWIGLEDQTARERKRLWMEEIRHD